MSFDRLVHSARSRESLEDSLNKYFFRGLGPVVEGCDVVVDDVPQPQFKVVGDKLLYLKAGFDLNEACRVWRFSDYD